MRRVAIQAFPVELGSVMKLANLADTGGQAKLLIQTGEVKVNGTVETRRGRKLVEGDVVEVGGKEPVELEAQ